MIVTGEHLRIARYLYGYNSQEQLADELGVSLTTIQRYETMDRVDEKILRKYRGILLFDLHSVVDAIENIRYKRRKNLTMALKV